MKIQSNGWVIINIGHPRTGHSYIVNETFSYKKSGSIKKFIEGSGAPWKRWRKKYNFRAVRATTTIITIENETR